MGVAAGLGVAVTMIGCGDGGTNPKPATTVNLTPGQSAVFVDSAHLVAHLQVQPGARYLIAVVNTDAANTSLEDFTLHGTLAMNSAAVATVTTRRPAPAPPQARAAGAVSDQEFRRLIAVSARAETAHLRRMAIDRALATRMGSPFSKLAARRARLEAQATARGQTARALAAPSETIGTVNRWLVRHFDGSCGAVDTIGARTVAVSSKAIILADTTSSWRTRPDSGYYQQLADEYSAMTYPEVTSYIGDPLLIDSTLSKVGKVTIVITPELNKDDGIAAFVNPCDFQVTAGSNITEAIYNWVADPINGFDLTTWERFLRPTLAHETKHISSFAQRFEDGGVFETVWLEEATAQMSSEIWMRSFDQTAWKSHAGFDATLGCEFVTSNPCYSVSKPAGLFNHLEFLYQYLAGATDTAPHFQNPEALGTTVESSYGAGWSFARWTADQYASSEQTFLHGIIDDETNTSIKNLAARSGQSPATLQVYWVLATALDSVQYTPTDPRLTVPSFDFANIFSVAHAVFGTTFPRLEPVWPNQITSGSFDQTVTGVHGLAGTSYFMLTATDSGIQTLELRSGSGGTITPGSGLRVGIVRVL
jgi:hypothetical protein